VTGIDLMAPEIIVGGAGLPDSWKDAVTGLRVEKALCLVGRATLRFADEGFKLSGSGKFALGTTVKIRVHGARTSSTLLSGLVTGISLEQNASDSPELVVTVDDLGHKLALGTQLKTYLQSTFLDAIKQIATQAGVQMKATSKNMTAIVHDYLLQSGSNLAFLNKTCERAGSVWWVEDDKLTIADVGADVGSVEVTLSDDLIEFSVRASALRPGEVTVKGWNANTQQDISENTSQAAATASSTFVNGYVGSKPATMAKSTQSTFDLNPKNGADAKLLATALYNDLASSAVIAKGRGHVNPDIKLMTKVKVAGAGPASGTYVVSQVEHIYRKDGFYTRFVAGPIRPGGLVDTLGPHAPDPGFEIDGLLAAVVTQVEDPDKMGRVKVKYAASGSTVESAWARVVGLGVGKQRGSVFQPEVNDEVLVGFERGDARYPVVLGGLYSSANSLPPHAGPRGDKSNTRTITSRLGHVIEMGDGTGPDAQHLLLMLAGGGHKLRLGADRFDIEVAQGKPILIKAGQAKFEIDNQGNVTIEGTKITLKAQSQVSIEGTAGVEVKSNAKVALQATMIDVKANGMATVDGGGQLALKGGIVAIN
jgi:uncharacterized protein involved in type VI secretion and phage assembly